MAEKNVLSGTQAGVVDPETSDVSVPAGEAAENKSGSVEQENKSAEVNPKPQQSKQENDKFAEFRRAKEKAEAEANALKAEVEKYKSIIPTIKEEYDINADDPDEIRLAILSQKTGKSKAELREEEAQRKAELEKQLESHPRVRELQQKAKLYEEELQRKQFAADLAEIKSKYPEETADGILDLGEEYIKLRAAGIANLVAYNAIKATRPQAETKPEAEQNPEPGAVDVSGAAEKEYLDEKELNKLSKDELLGNPSILEKAMKSLSRLRKQT